MRPLNILFVAELAPGSRSYQRIRRLQMMGHSVETLSLVPPDATYETKPRLIDRIRHRLRYPQDRSGANDRLRNLPAEPRPDIIWFERATTVPGATLRAIKQAHPDCKLIWYAEDDMMNPAHLSRQVASAIPFYDLWVTTKSFNTRPEELPSLGAKSILFVNNAYDIEAHSPIELSGTDRQNFAADISFVGTWEHPRAETVRQLAEAGSEWLIRQPVSILPTSRYTVTIIAASSRHRKSICAFCAGATVTCKPAALLKSRPSVVS